MDPENSIDGMNLNEVIEKCKEDCGSFLSGLRSTALERLHKLCEEALGHKVRHQIADSDVNTVKQIKLRIKDILEHRGAQENAQAA